MELLIAALPLWVLITLLLIVITGSISFLHGLLKILKTVFNKDVEVGGNRWNFSSKNDKNSDGFWVSPHKNCPHKRDILIILAEHSELIQQKSNIELVLRLKTQMNYADGAIQTMRSKLQSLYADKLTELEIKDVGSSQSYKTYHIVLTNMAEIFITKIRQAFLNNGFDRLNEKDFKEYFENRFNYFKGEFIDIMNNLYLYEEDINLGYLCIINAEHETELKESIRKIFDKARDIAIDFNVKLLEIDEKKEKLINKYI